jgi:hypothetical protein
LIFIYPSTIEKAKKIIKSSIPHWSILLLRLIFNICGHVFNLCLRKVETNKKIFSDTYSTRVAWVFYRCWTQSKEYRKMIFLNTGPSYPTHVVGVSYECQNQHMSNTATRVIIEVLVLYRSWMVRSLNKGHINWTLIRGSCKFTEFAIVVNFSRLCAILLFLLCNLNFNNFMQY